jgi:Protein of unknown function (DUF3225)
MTSDIDRQETVAELRSLHAKYEKALVENDVSTLTSLFWVSPQVMRFGASENLYGSEEIEAFRKARPSAGLARVVKRLDIVAFGRDVGSITLEFERRADSRTIHGRQTQLWVRLEEGWRIVSAHVSLLP